MTSLQKYTLSATSTMRRGQRGWKVDSAGLPAAKAYSGSYVEPPAGPPNPP